MRGKNSNRLARLDQQSFLIAELLQFANDGVKALPVARGLANASVDNKVRGPLGNLGVEVVHQTAEGGFLLPALATQRVAAGGADRRSHCRRHTLT